MHTLKQAREYETTQNSKQLTSYFKHLGDMNYQILVDAHQSKHFTEKLFEDSLSNHAIQSVLNGKDYHGIKNKPFELFVTGFFDNETTIQWACVFILSMDH